MGGENLFNFLSCRRPCFTDLIKGSLEFIFLLRRVRDFNLRDDLQVLLARRTDRFSVLNLLLMAYFTKRGDAL